MLEQTGNVLESGHLDEQIRKTLLDADRAGRLHEIAARVGIAGGVEALRRIAESSGELHIMDRGMLGLHLGLVSLS